MERDLIVMSDTPEQRRRRGIDANWLHGAVAASILLLSCGSVVGPAEQVVDSRVIDDRISDESYRSWRFDLPKGGRNFRLKGSFVVTSGGSRDISAFVVDRTEYVNYRSGNNFYPLYSRRRVTTGEFDLRLQRDLGPYYFILSNRFSLFTDKRVKGSVALTYD